MAAGADAAVRAGAAVVPYGHVVGSEKWRGSRLVRGLQGRVQLVLEEDLALVDFHLPHGTCILYVSEADAVAGNGFRRRLARFRSASNLNGIVVAERTPMSSQYFPAMQNFVVLELGMTLLPVANEEEASQLIIQLVHEQSKDRTSNPFLRKQCSQLTHASILRTVQQIPGVGKTKALLLLQQFGSIHQLCNASVQELEQVVGQTVAQQIYAFFTQAN